MNEKLRRLSGDIESIDPCDGEPVQTLILLEFYDIEGSELCNILFDLW